jgi:hypothetical protein
MGLPPNPLNPAVPLWGSILTGIPAAVPHSNALLALLRDGVVKRRTYFSFHFEDVWRYYVASGTTIFSVVIVVVSQHIVVTHE